MLIFSFSRKVVISSNFLLSLLLYLPNYLFLLPLCQLVFLRDFVIMLQKDSPKKKCVILPLANTDLYTSARIIISYYSSNQMKPYRYVQRLYLRLGPMVVSTVRYPKVSVHHTLRAMLIAVCLYPKFLHYLPSVRSADFLGRLSLCQDLPW